MDNNSSKLDAMDINTRIARRLRELRDARGYSLDALAERSGVSRSNISLIERRQSSPSAVVLDKLATGLGVAVVHLFQDSEDATAAAPSPLARAMEQPVWTDPATGYVRRNLSPAAPSPLQLVDVRFPPGQRVEFGHGPREAEIEQQVWMIEGEMEISLGEQTWLLRPGDCLAMCLDQAITYRNTSRQAARYLVALAHPTSTLPRRP